jgi:hypothetical protein
MYLQHKERADLLARRLSTYLPDQMDPAVWSLPILEALVDRIERLEKELHEIRKARGCNNS